MTTWLKALYRAILAFFASRKEDQEKAQDLAQAEQDEIVQEAQDEIDQIPKMSDAELDARLVDVGLVQPEDSGGAREPAKRKPDSAHYRYPKAPWKTDRKPDF